MPITIKKPTGGKLAKGRDHLLKCQLTWDDETHPDFTDSDVHLYVIMKANDAADDEDAVIAFNSEDNPDQFIYNATGWTGEGKVKIGFKKEDQHSIVPVTGKYCMDVVCIMKLLDQVRTEIRKKHYSIRTEDAYCAWINQFILFHDKKHPKDMGEKEISEFISYLAVKRFVAASTQNQALNAIVFLYK